MPAAITESEPWQAARDGDAGAFEALYRTHVGRVYGLCLRMCGDPGLAEELTQDAFVQAWKKLDTFKGNSAFGTWLHRVAANTVLQHFRREGRRRGREFSLEVSEAAGNVPVRAAETGVAMDLEAALDHLPEGARAVFVLHDVEGFKHTEIAEMMGTAPGSSKAQLHRARKLLREVLR
jgi:RNA polymerase sigma-70 factor (ECF subfamily)